MDLFEELESQLAAPFAQADQVTVVVDGHHLSLSNIQLGADFLSGTFADCWALIKLNAITCIRGTLPMVNDVTCEAALNHMRWPRRARFSVVGERQIALGVAAGFLKLHSRAGGYLRPLASVSLLLLEAVENSKPKN